MSNISNSKSVRNWPVLAFLLSLALWLGALGFEHIGNLAPCQMCYWQRHAHKAVLVIAVLALLSQKFVGEPRLNRAFILLLALAFAVSFGLAFWHVGVEYKWWEGPKSCMVGSTEIDMTNILEALNKPAKMPACSDAPWHLFNISMAGYNALISGLACLVSFGIFVRSK